MPKGIIIFFVLVLVIIFFYDNLPLSEQLKSFLPDNKKYASYIIIFIGIFTLLIFFGVYVLPHYFHSIYYEIF